jgi:hypothetical protein
MLIDPFKPPAAFQPLGGVAVLADNSWADNRVLMHRGRK